MNKSQFDELVANKESEFEEAMDEWQSEYLLGKVISAKASNHPVCVNPNDVPEGFTIEAVADYLESNGFVLTRFFANDMSGKGKSFVLEIA